MKLSDKVAVVTGGRQAIGLACVEALAEAGANAMRPASRSSLTQEFRIRSWSRFREPSAR
jgi:NAD(P)-dependent dehydrogenase (short-subunit alcohol dehydrogenase family)